MSNVEENQGIRKLHIVSTLWVRRNRSYWDTVKIVTVLTVSIGNQAYQFIDTWIHWSVPIASVKFISSFQQSTIHCYWQNIMNIKHFFSTSWDNMYLTVMYICISIDLAWSYWWKLHTCHGFVVHYQYHNIM